MCRRKSIKSPALFERAGLVASQDTASVVTMGWGSPRERRFFPGNQAMAGYLPAETERDPSIPTAQQDGTAGPQNGGKAAVIFPHDCGGIPMCPSLGPADFRGSLFYQPPDYTVLGLQASVCPTACMILYSASVIFEEVHKTSLYKWSLNQDYICKERLPKPYMGGVRGRVSRYGAPCKGPSPVSVKKLLISLEIRSFLLLL